MTPNRLIILGAGGHAKVVAETAQAAGWTIAGFLDPGKQAGQTVLGWPVLGDGNDLGPWRHGHAFFPAIGDGMIRWREFERLRAMGALVPALLHPAATMSPSSEVEPGTVVMAAAVVQASAHIGPAGIVNTGATIDHDCRIGAGVMIAPGATLCGGVVVGDHAFIAAGAVLTPGVCVGRSAFVGAGTVVVDNLPENARLRSVRRNAICSER